MKSRFGIFYFVYHLNIAIIKERRVEANQLGDYNGYVDNAYTELIAETNAKFEEIERRLQQVALKANTQIKFYEVKTEVREECNAARFANKPVSVLQRSRCAS